MNATEPTLDSAPNFRIGVDALALIKRLETVSVGETVTYLDLNAVINGDVQGKAYQSLQTARKRLLNEKRTVFGTVNGVGLKRLASTEIVEQEVESVSKIRRGAKRSLKRLAAADYDTLPQQQKIQHNITSSTLGAITLCTSRKAQNLLEQKAQDSSKLDLGDTMKLFASKA
jgi:hypothetical protein